MFLDGKSLQENPINAGCPRASILGPTLFLLCINDLSGDVICDIAIYADDTTLYYECDQESDLICGNKLNWFLNLNLSYETVWTGVRSGLLISMLGRLSWFCLTGLTTLGSCTALHQILTKNVTHNIHIMTLIDCFVEWLTDKKTLSLISTQDRCQILTCQFHISNTLQAGF